MCQRVVLISVFHAHCLLLLSVPSPRPFNKAMLKAAEKEDGEDMSAAKKRKPNPAKSSLKDLLPAPRNGHAPAGDHECRVPPV
jgi:hypothetical protein